MLVTFHSKVTADILMRSDDVHGLLRAAGKSYGDKIPERGVFTREQLASAIAGLERVIKAEDRHNPDEDEHDPDKPPVHPIDQHVGLHQRAFPLLDMMRRSLEAGEDVTWETSRGW
ncbi:DUF1840 domain-containing protein [Bordetella genomosp. 13]|uniref:DUF1840 domain-containing protein n=1 Tax=Bordetella genomosp. 13 TaxID=463040 RepID=A0A1W6Z6F1_9BORD|nr:DUF1840 domain-containing protein [Bordetella genomosp. 13]ARP92963.1 hypothetical protein CAL15_00365 [Bordetella genomosp. 13]